MNKMTPLERHQARCGTEFCTLHVAAPNLLAALESAPEPLTALQASDRIRLIDFHEDTYRAWFHGPRAAALAKVKP